MITMATKSDMTALPFDPFALTWLRGAARAVDWFRARVDQTGRLDAATHDLGSYYKWPLLLCSLGRFALAQTVLQTIVDEFMTDKGDFRTGDDKSRDPLYGLIADSYTNTWPIVAARVLERSDIARPALECLRARRIERTGGYLTGFADQHTDRRQDIVTIAGCGNAFLAWGELEEALAAGECLIRVLEMQKGPANPFYLYLDGDGKLLTQLDIPERLTCIRIDQPDQVYVYLGMAAVFLARLFAVTGARRFLVGAQGYFAVNQACGEAVYCGTGSCKTGWAAATLFRLTGREEYRYSTRRAAAAVLAEQLENGSWQSPDRSATLNCDATGELGYHLVQYCTELAAYEGGRDAAD